MAASGKNPSLDVKDSKSASGAGPVFSKKSSLKGKILTAYNEIIELLKNLQKRYEAEIKKKIQETYDLEHYNQYVKNETGKGLLTYIRGHALSAPGMESLHDKCNQVLSLSELVEKAAKEKPIKKESLPAIKKTFEDAKNLLSQSRGILESRGAEGLSGAETIKRILSKLDPLMVEMDKRKERKTLTDEKSKKIIMEIREILVDVGRTHNIYLKKLFAPAVNNDIKQLQEAVEKAVETQQFTAEQLEILQEKKLDPQYWAITSVDKLYYPYSDSTVDRFLTHGITEEENERLKSYQLDLPTLKAKQLSLLCNTDNLEMMEKRRAFRDNNNSLDKVAIQTITIQLLTITLVAYEVGKLGNYNISFPEILSRLGEVLSYSLQKLIDSQVTDHKKMLELWLVGYKSKTVQEIFVLSAIPENLKSMKDRFFTPKSLVTILQLLEPWKPKPVATATTAAAVQPTDARDHKSDRQSLK